MFFSFLLRSFQYARFHFPHENKVRLKLHREIYLFLTPAKPKHLVLGQREKTGNTVDPSLMVISVVQKQISIYKKKKPHLA